MYVCVCEWVSGAFAIVFVLMKLTFVCVCVCCVCVCVCVRSVCNSVCAREADGAVAVDVRHRPCAYVGALPPPHVRPTTCSLSPLLLVRAAKSLYMYTDLGLLVA